MFAPDASSSAAFVDPAGQAVHTLLTTCSSAAHLIPTHASVAASHVLPAPVHTHSVDPSAAEELPAGQTVQSLLESINLPAAHTH